MDAQGLLRSWNHGSQGLAPALEDSRPCRLWKGSYEERCGRKAEVAGLLSRVFPRWHSERRGNLFRAMGYVICGSESICGVRLCSAHWRPRENQRVRVNFKVFSSFDGFIRRLKLCKMAATASKPSKRVPRLLPLSRCLFLRSIRRRYELLLRCEGLYREVVDSHVERFQARRAVLLEGCCEAPRPLGTGFARGGAAWA